IFIAPRAAELSNLPAFVCEDGFILSHTLEPVDVLDKAEIAKYLGERKPLYNLLDTDHPIMAGHLSLPDSYMEHRRKLAEGMMEAPRFIDQAYREFGERFGREYDWMEIYDPHDAEVAVLIIGSAAGTAKETVDFMAEEGKRVAVIKLRVPRPLPVERLRKALGKYKIVAIMERADSFKNHGGPMFSEIAGALYHHDKHPILRSYYYGFGGRDIFPEDFMRVYNDLLDMAAGKKEIPEIMNYAGLKED
ncbi:MAG: pyruvate ferredoxin oxidoreductase, partial [candidate division WOR-3 bacterium]